jgi:uncharacterized membrane protein YjfL (UPF0719 family)
MERWDFEGDEGFFLFAAAAAGVVSAIRWYRWVVISGALARSGWQRAVLGLIPLAGLAFLMFILQTWADPVWVVGRADYTLLFMAGGVLWVFGTVPAFAALGISARDDAIERNNPAATVAVAGAMLGMSLAYTLSNIGGGPTIWTTLVPAIVATTALLALWWVLEVTTHVSEMITVERDVATGLRLGGFLLACGAILGRGMSGDWHDWNGTFMDFVRLAWPCVLLLVFAAVCSLRMKPSPEQPRPNVARCGLLPVIMMLLAAAVYIWTLGAPEVKPAPTGAVMTSIASAAEGGK